MKNSVSRNVLATIQILAPFNLLPQLQLKLQRTNHPNDDNYEAVI
jgi:hypothetical protein